MKTTREPEQDLDVGCCGMTRVVPARKPARAAPAAERTWHTVRLGSDEGSPGRVTWLPNPGECYFILQREHVILPNQDYCKISIAPRKGGESLVLEFESAKPALCNTWLHRLRREKRMCCASSPPSPPPLLFTTL